MLESRKHPRTSGTVATMGLRADQRSGPAAFGRTGGWRLHTECATVQKRADWDQEVIMRLLKGLLGVVVGLLTAVLGTVLGILAAVLWLVGALLCVTVILLPLGIPVVKLARRLFTLSRQLMRLP